MANIPGNFQRQDRMTVNGLMPKNPACVVCRKSAQLCCRRCGDFYCSGGCQNFDWPSHRYICFRMPILVPIGEQYSNTMSDIISLPDEEPFAFLNQSNQFREQQQHSQQQQLPLQNYKQFTQQPQPHQVQQQPQPLLQLPYQQPQQQQQLPQTKNKIDEYPLQNSTVIVTGFRSSNICSIISADPNKSAEYYKILQIIADYGKSAQPMHVSPNLGSYVLSELDGKFCRACIKASKGPQFRLYFIDFGVERIRNITEMRKISNEIHSLKQCAFSVQLSFLPQTKNFVGHVQKFYDTLKNKEYKIVYDEKRNNKNHVRFVELFNLQTGISLHQHISNYINKNLSSHSNNNSNTSIPSRPQKDDSLETCSLVSSPEESKEPDLDTSSTISAHSNASTIRQRLQVIKKNAKIEKKVREPVLNPPFELKKWDAKDTQVHAVIVDTSALNDGIFGCVKDADLNNLKEVMAFMTKYTPNDQSFEPICSEYCVALFDDKWYRAKCIGIDGDKFTVIYIDFSNEAVLTKDKIRPYPMECKLDCRTIACAIGELENLNKEQITFIRNWGIDDFSEIIIDKIISASDEFYLVEVNDLLTKMRCAKLLD